jgi:O-antigen ligase
VDRSGGWGPVARCENGEIRASPIWELGPPVFYAKYAGCHHVHQSYLDLLLRTGVVGLLLFVGMGVRLLYLAARAFASTKSDRSMPFFFLAALCVFAVASLTDSLVFSQQGWMLLSLVAGIILATCRKKESHDSQ